MLGGFGYKLLAEESVLKEVLPPLTGRVEQLGCPSGCTDIVAQSFGLKFDPRLSMVIAALFFCCHLPCHRNEMVPIVGAVIGAKIYASIF